jgi:pSer/pThr/pTyr-binding forkhead associated (FHA) protein
MLFLPTGPPVPLPGEGTILIGRASKADLQISEADASRRHAEVVCSADGYRLHDLGSTNGTYVNGRRVEEHVLEAGDRIEIGDTVIAFCRVRTDIESSPDDSRSTLFREQPAPSWTREAFRGDLAEIPPYAVVQILELGRKTGELSIDGDTTTGRLWLRRGDPVHAETKTQAGFDAAVALVTVSAGSFKFEPCLETPPTTIEANVTQLLLEASRVVDEQNAS